MKVGASSWHHTSYRYNITDHYKLTSLADELIKNNDTLDAEYKTYRADQKLVSRCAQSEVIVQS